MADMFRANGYANPSFELDVSSFDTSKVTNMSYMFYYVGQLNPNFNIDLSN
jgi:surface protein